MLSAAVTIGSIAHADPKREVPDYDGRGNPDADGDSWALWVPRVVLWPVYAVNEYVVRRPLGAVVRHAERDHWADTVESLVTFGEGGKQMIVPTALFDFGLLPSVGLYYAGDDLFADDNQLRIHAATWGTPWIDVTAADRYAITKSDTIQARFEFKRSEDNLFVGIGPDVTEATRSRFGLERLEGGLSYRRRIHNESRIELEAGIHRLAFVSGECCGDPSLDTRIANGELMTPPGYGDDYTAAYGRADLLLDTREPRPAPGSGAFLRLRGRPSFDMHDQRSWIQYGGVVGGAVDLTGHQRILKMQLAVDFVDSMRGGPVPFTEYAVLGGDLLPGFVTGWLTGQSTAAAQIGYTWPIWIGLDAQTRFTVGNAFGDHLDGLAPRKLRMTGDFGFTTSTARDQGFEVLFGVGTETFEQGAGITSVRATFGTRRGF